MEDRESAVISSTCAFLKRHMLVPLVIQADGNPFLIGVATKIDKDCIMQVHEEAGYVTIIPVRRIVEVHTSTT